MYYSVDKIDFATVFKRLFEILVKNNYETVTNVEFNKRIQKNCIMFVTRYKNLNKCVFFSVLADKIRISVLKLFIISSYCSHKLQSHKV